MRFAIALHFDKKKYLILAELVSTTDTHETWSISPKDAPDKAIVAVNDRPLTLSKNKIAERFSWTRDGRPVDGNLKQVTEAIEWRIYFHINKGAYGINPKDAW